MLRPHRRGQTEGHNDQYKTLLHLWQGAEADVRHGCRWEEVSYHFHEFLNAGGVPAQEMGNQGREVCAQGRFSLGLQWEVMINMGGRARIRERVPRFRCSGDSQLPLEDQENTACFSSCTQSRSLPPEGPSYTLAPRAWTGAPLWRKGRNQAHVPEKLLDPRITAVTPEVSLLPHCHRRRGLRPGCHDIYPPSDTLSKVVELSTLASRQFHTNSRRL